MSVHGDQAEALCLPVSCFDPAMDPPDVPLAFVDLATTARASAFTPPPFPVIGLGPPDHPLAADLDAVIVPPVRAEALVTSVCAAPRAAAATVRLLRLLPFLAADQALVAESLAYAMLQGSAEHRAWRRARRLVPAPCEPGAVLLDRDERRLTITLASPARGNVIDAAVRDRLHEAFRLAALDPTIAAVSLRALGRAFSLGAALDEFGTTDDPATADAIRARTLPAIPALACAHKLDVHVDGACIGAGLELAAFARRLTASRRAWFQLPELAMGILPGAGGCVSLTRRIGRQRTVLLILSGARLSARRALDWGLIDALVDEPA